MRFAYIVCFNLMYVWCGENVSSDSLEMCCVFCSVVFVVVLVGFLDII